MTTQADTELIERLLKKAQEAFILAIELYNRPTIDYHTEGCAFFLCNAWELMLKAHLMKTKGPQSIYYPKKDRTLSLEDCLKRVFTNEHDPLRQNMNQVIRLRNTSTHFVTTEYELFYGPILQACVRNFDRKILDLHGISMSERIPENYLALSVRRDIFNSEAIRAKYPPEIASRLFQTYNEVQAPFSHEGHENYAAVYETHLVLTKKRAEADLTIAVDSSSDSRARIITDIRDEKNIYPYKCKNAIDEVNRRLRREGIEVFFRGNQRPFNSHDWNLFVKFFSFKEDSKYSRDISRDLENKSVFVYSHDAVNLVVQQLQMNPKHALDDIKKKLAEKN